MNYSTYTMSNGTTVVTIDDYMSEEYEFAWESLVLCGANSGDFGNRYIFTDNGDRSRFEAFEQAVEEARKKE